MTDQYRPAVGASYYYRADGMRVEKVEGVTINWTEPENEEQASGHYDLNYAENRPTTRYFYDGQMPMEEDYNPSGSITKVTRNTLGGRGIDMISTTQSSTTTLAFPLYDGHGNMVATLSRGTSSYTVGNQRTYDVWGAVRSGSATGDPTKRYCANLGHQADDESDLIYMRARYYEPGSGRFLNEDPARDGFNWFSYCGNEPISRVDASGKAWDFIQAVIDGVLPILKSFGLQGVINIGKKLGARALGYALEAIGTGLCNLGYFLARQGMVMAESANAFVRIGGALLGRLGAKAVAAGLQIKYWSYLLIAFGNDSIIGPRGDGIETPLD